MENKNHQWIIDLAMLMAILPMLYTAGWSFAYHYFECFHIGLLALNIPKEYFFLYSFWVVKGQWFILIPVLVALGVLYFLAIHFIRKYIQANPLSDIKKHLIQAGSVILVPAFVLLMFWLCYDLGDREAKKAYQYQAEKHFPYYPRVKVWTTSEKSESEKSEKEEWQNGCYCMLLINSEKVFVFYPGEKKIPTRIDVIPTDVHVIPMEKIKAMEILPQYKSGENCKK